MMPAQIFLIRYDEAPANEVHILQSIEPPGGMGEAKKLARAHHSLSAVLIIG